MGRRALPKVDPLVDLSRHYAELESFEGPLPFDSWFAAPEGPLEVEIGSGKGLFLRRWAATHPERNFLGIEIARKYARYAAYRLARAGTENAVMLQGDGIRLMRELIPDGSLAAVHIYFPDPWWKARHHKRRVMTREMLVSVERTLQIGGRFHFWTDVQEYFDNSLELIRETTQLAGPFEVPEAAPEHDLDYRTHFERRMRQHDQPVYRAEYERVAERT